MKPVIEFYNGVASNLPDHNRLKNLKLPGTSVVLDGKGDKFAELFESDQRRVWVPLSQMPEYVQRAFVAAEDKRFYQHKGIDERGLIRAFITNIAEPGRPQGGSTITQQVAKNLLVGDDVSYERKIREMIVASRIDQSLSKDEILEIYLNSIYLGRGAWGIDTAARSYFKKPASALSVTEGAMLAAMAKGPSYFSPDRYPERTRERFAYVLKRMQEDKVAGAEAVNPGVTGVPRIVPYERPRREAGFHFVDHLLREAKTLVGMQSLTSESYTVRSTINSKLQRAAEAALQDGLARYEATSNRAKYEGPELNLGEITARVTTEQSTHALRRGRVVKPIWQIALQSARLPLYDVHWPAAVVLSNGGKAQIKVGLNDGRIVPLSVPEHVAPDALHVNDVIYVNVIEGKKQSDAKAELRIRPKVQGAALVLENKTGRILAMVGGFSYPLSQLNRTSQALRQPGSSIKPLTYLAALHGGLQPNTLVLDAPVTLPPIPGVTTHILDAEELRQLELGLDHAAPRAGEFEEPRHRAPARRRHRQGPDQEPGADLRSGAASQDLSRVHEELSVRARRPVAADDRSRGLLRRDRQRRPARHALCHRLDRAERPRRLQASGRRAGHDGGRRPRGVLSAPHHPRRRGGARHRGLDAGIWRISSAARPAPPTTRTTPGSSASPATSPSRSGSATTTPAASRRSAAARPAATSPSPSSSRSSRPPGIFTGRRRRCRRPRRKPRAISRRCRSITPADKSSPPAARAGSPSISSSTPTRSCGTLNIRWPGATAWRAASRGP